MATFRKPHHVLHAVLARPTALALATVAAEALLAQLPRALRAPEIGQYTWATVITIESLRVTVGGKGAFKRTPKREKRWGG